LQPVFHRDTYDHITNNCNHFTDRLCMYLLGRRLPDEVLQQTDHLMKLTTVKLLRPFLQWYCRDHLGQGSGRGSPAPVAKTSKWETVEPDAHLAVGTIVGIHPVHARDGPVVLGAVCEPQHDGLPKRVHRSDTTFVPNAFCGCNSIDQVPKDEIWVRYFHISLNESLRSCVGQVCAESVPRARISLTQLESAGTASVYHAAMLMMNASSQRNVGASSGLGRPRPSMLPTIGFEDELLDDQADAAPFSAHRLGNGSGTLWAVMANLPRTSKERDALQQLVERGYDVQAASAALAASPEAFADSNSACSLDILSCAWAISPTSF